MKQPRIELFKQYFDWPDLPFRFIDVTSNPLFWKKKKVLLLLWNDLLVSSYSKRDVENDRNMDNVVAWRHRHACIVGSFAFDSSLRKHPFRLALRCWGRFLRDLTATITGTSKNTSFNPLNPKIKLWIVICCSYSFLQKKWGEVNKISSKFILCDHVCNSHDHSVLQSIDITRRNWMLITLRAKRVNEHTTTTLHVHRDCWLISLPSLHNYRRDKAKFYVDLRTETGHSNKFTTSLS